MASDGDDIERLLRDVEASLSGKPAATPAKRGSGSTPVPAKSSGGSAGGRVSRAAVSAAVAGVVVGLLFAFLPFVAGVSGGLGAALAVFVLVLLRG